ncbi:MAG TPA: hypothetical protein VLB02_00925 [Candidatus Paceibacterota bacterium]|nr:hypothetical protein [Candidatus Paceibacterota bacterium]
MKKIIILLLVVAAVYAFFSRTPKTENEPVPQPVQQSLSPQAGLPVVVEAKRQAIYRAARSGSYEQLAAEAETPFGYSYGDPETDFVTFLKNAATHEGKSALDMIPLLLAQPYGVQGNIYVWPGVFAKSAEEWTDADIVQMKQLLTDEQIEGYRQFGAYAYYRIGITTEGKWVYYIAGD